MKTFFLLAALLFQTMISYAQNQEWSEYGPWSGGICFPQLISRVKTISNPKLNTTSVMVEFKNNYSRKVTFSYDGFNNSFEAKQAFALGKTSSGRQSSISIGAGQNSTYTFSIKEAGGRGVYIEIYSLYFDNDYQHYQKCSDGSVCLYCQVNSDNEPACPNYAKNGLSVNDHNSASRPQNDLTEYNRSKAEMEKQLEERNAISRQDADNAYQSYKQYFEAGVRAYDNNNFGEAQTQFQLAYNASTTDQQRRSAKDNYNKALNAPKRQAISGLINGGADALRDATFRVTQNSLADLQTTLLKERALKKILKGNEASYPEAMQYYNEYLKEKKLQNRRGNRGLAIMGAGIIATVVGAEALGSESGGGPGTDALVYGGLGALGAGLGITIFTIGPSKKEKDALNKAATYVHFGTTSSGVGLALNF